MNVSAIYNGEDVTIVSIDPNGSTALVSYITSAGELKIGKNFIEQNTSAHSTIATSAGIV